MDRHPQNDPDQIEFRRLCILGFLHEVMGAKSNDYVLQTALGRLGHVVTRTIIQADLRFLQDAGLVTIEDQDFVVVCQLTEAGHDVAARRTTVKGISRR